MRAMDQEMLFCAVPRRVADDALRERPQLLRRNGLDFERQEARRGHRNERNLAEHDLLETRVRVIGSMKGEVGGPFAQAFGGSADRLVIEVQAGAVPAGEEGRQYRQNEGPGAQIAEHHADHRFLASGQLPRIGAEFINFAQRDGGARVEHASGFGERHAISAAVQQDQAEPLFELADRGEYRRMRAAERIGGRLEAAQPDHGIEAPQLVQLELRGFVRNFYSHIPILVILPDKGHR